MSVVMGLILSAAAAAAAAAEIIFPDMFRNMKYKRHRLQDREGGL